jgi:hypothetical protein
MFEPILGFGLAHMHVAEVDRGKAACDRAVAMGATEVSQEQEQEQELELLERFDAITQQLEQIVRTGARLPSPSPTDDGLARLAPLANPNEGRESVTTGLARSGLPHDVLLEHELV